MRYIILSKLQRIFNVFPKFIHNIIWNMLISSESIIALAYRYMYFKRYTNHMGQNIYIGKFTVIKNIEKLSLQNNVSIQAFTYLDAYGGISIGNNVSIANHCTLISSDHTWQDKKTPIKYNSVIPKPIFIKDDVWVAAGVRVLGNVTIEERCVVGAGAVVNKSTEPNSLYVGVPIQKIKEI